jgi:hypothetical protein
MFMATIILYISPFSFCVSDNCYCVCFQLKKKPRDKPLLRRKSELPHDMSMVKTLETYKRADNYLVTNQEGNKQLQQQQPQPQ